MTEGDHERLALEVTVLEHEGPELSAAGLEQYLTDCFQIVQDVDVTVGGPGLDE